MRLFGLLFFLALAGAPNLVCAQTNVAPAAQPPREVAFLTEAQQKEYAAAHNQALAADPALKAEGDALMKQIIGDPTIVEQADFQQKLTAHRQKLRAGMLKQDSHLGPIFAEIDKHLPPTK
jgi:hypothetical protein